MKRIFIEAHKMTRKMVEEYGVNYQAQFGLCISYLLELKEEKEMLNEEIKSRLQELEISEEDIQNAEDELKNYEVLTNDIVESMYNDRAVRSAMNGRGFWDYEYLSKTPNGTIDRYLGEGKIQVERQKLWENYGKIRIYFDVTIDGLFTLNKYIAIK